MEKMMNMEYNSQREHLIIPEYGRNVQNLIAHAKGIENPELRQAFTEKVVELMMQMHPQNKNLEDYRDKIWLHLFRIANYELEVSPPEGVTIPSEEELSKRPDHVGYPRHGTKYRHYGYNVQNLIDKALEMEPGPVRQGFVEAIGSYMKLAYKTWNKEPYVSDEVILGDLDSLSNGQLSLGENVSLDNLGSSNNNNHNRKRKRSNNSGGGKSNHSKGGGGRHQNNNRHKRKRK